MEEEHDPGRVFVPGWVVPDGIEPAGSAVAECDQRADNVAPYLDRKDLAEFPGGGDDRLHAAAASRVGEDVVVRAGELLCLAPVDPLHQLSFRGAPQPERAAGSPQPAHLLS